jgi:hypothetical protein
MWRPAPSFWDTAVWTPWRRSGPSVPGGPDEAVTARGPKGSQP